MSRAFNKLSKAEAERLHLLVEELSEAIQAACKILRHGYESSNPEIIHMTNNRYDLEKELGHVQNSVNMMLQSGDLEIRRIDMSKEIKAVEVRRYLHHQD